MIKVNGKEVESKGTTILSIILLIPILILVIWFIISLLGIILMFILCLVVILLPVILIAMFKSKKKVETKK